MTRAQGRTIDIALAKVPQPLDCLRMITLTVCCKVQDSLLSQELCCDSPLQADVEILMPAECGTEGFDSTAGHLRFVTLPLLRLLIGLPCSSLL